MRHNKSADGLRGVAALCVVIAHFVEAFIPSLTHKNYPQIFSENLHPSLMFKICQSPFFSIFYNGHFAVLIFFVLSGYVLSMPYFEGDVVSLKKRVWGRYIRLNFPIIGALIFAYIVFKLGGYYNVEAARLSGSVHWLSQLVPAALSFHDFFKMTLYKSILFGDSSLITTLWTLKVEFIGSIYLLLFYLCCPKGGIKIFTAFSVCLLLAFYGQDSLYYIAIFWGAFINLIKFKRSCFIFFIGMYFGSYQINNILYNFLPVFRFFDAKTLYNTIGAFFVVIAVVNGFGRAFFESRIVNFFGNISFSVYLLHPIILASAACYLYITLPKNLWSLNFVFIIYLSLLLGASCLFSRYIDRFSIKMSHGFSKYFFKRENYSTNFMSKK